MVQLAIAMDLGTSGFRAQAIELPSGEIISTAISMHHPLPGANVMDHVHLALELGNGIVASMMVGAINQLISTLHVSTDQVIRFAVCGNPIQLSLLQGIEIRDLAYAGTRKLKSLGVVPPKREAMNLTPRDFQGLNLPGNCCVIIPPTVRHEVGADALAMMIQTGILGKDETSLVVDFGTNAEMALLHNGKVITGSAAAGPALEGQQIACGMLATPGVVSDLEALSQNHRLILLDSEMLPVKGPLIDLRNIDRPKNVGRTPWPIGITGTGTIAIIHQAMEAGLITPPSINTEDRQLHLGEDVYFTEKDLLEAGKAFGALRAGHLTLCHEAGISLEDIETMYMSGASGTYVDAIKAQKLGLVPPRVKSIYQVGNTSLAMARDLAINPDNLDIMTDLANRLKQTHCMFAASQTFKKIYLLEHSYWTEGMPISLYRKILQKYSFPGLPDVGAVPRVSRTVKRDIDDHGRFGLRTVATIGRIRTMCVEGCTGCLCCAGECPGGAIAIVSENGSIDISLDESLCNGVACKHCEFVCPEKVFILDVFFRFKS